MKKLVNLAGLCAALLIPAVVWTQSRQRLVEEGRPLWPNVADDAGNTPQGAIPRNEKLRLAGLLRDMAMMHDDSNTPLSPAQARDVLAAVRPMRHKPEMTVEEAYLLGQKLNKMLTPAQHSELDRQRNLRLTFQQTFDKFQDAELVRKAKPMELYLAAFNPIRPLVKDKKFKELPDPLRQRIEERCTLMERLFEALERSARK